MDNFGMIRLDKGLSVDTFVELYFLWWWWLNKT